jgi:ATP-dependent Lon protease
MTGEVTLRGKVMPVGGIKEKVIAAHRAGIRELILPTQNKKDLEEVPENVRKKLKFNFVDNIDQVVRIAFGPTRKARG